METIDQRAAPRYRVHWPVEMEQGEKGVTKDMSATGMLLETEKDYPLGSLLKMDVLLPALGELAQRLHCLANVVRVEPRDGRYRVGLQLVETSFVCA